MLTKLRKALGRSPRDTLTYRDFCSFYQWDEELVKENMLINLVPIFIIGLIFWIFRDDFDLVTLYGIILIVLKLGRTRKMKVSEPLKVK